jgi:hypothetical protein
METSYILDNLTETFNITRSKTIVVRSNLSKNKFISRGKYTFHIHDVFYMVYGFLLSPGNFKQANLFFTQMLENEAFICEAFDKMQLLGFDQIENVTFGKWYIIVNAKNLHESFVCGKIKNMYTDRSNTISGEKLNSFFNKLK